MQACAAPDFVFVPAVVVLVGFGFVGPPGAVGILGDPVGPGGEVGGVGRWGVGHEWFWNAEEAVNAMQQKGRHMAALLVDPNRDQLTRGSSSPLA